MHGAAFFSFGVGRGGAEEKKFGVGRGGAGRNSSGRVTVKLGAFSGWGRAGRGSFENFRGRGGPGQPFSPGPGRGGTCIPARYTFECDEKPCKQ